jgi:hypothetical protein
MGNGEVPLSTSTNVGPGTILMYMPTYLLEFRMKKNVLSLYQINLRFRHGENSAVRKRPKC